MNEQRLKEQNLIAALKLGMIDWFVFFDVWKKL